MRAVFSLLVTTALVSAPAAYAQSNNQHQAGDATAVTDVEAGYAEDAGATAISSGNAVSTTQNDSDTDLASTQHMDGDASAEANATVWTATGNIAVTSAAVGNGGTAVINGGSSNIEAQQLDHGDVNATVTLRNGYSHNAAVSSSASSNTAAVSAENAEVRVLMNQESSGAVNASAEMDADYVEDQAVSGVIASANNLSIGGETATVLNATHQSATGASVTARSDLYAGSATDASGNATANANSTTIDNQWGYVNAAIEQDATSQVQADSYVTLGSDFIGFASAGAYGVGNQATVANIGSDTVMDVTQTNGGDVSANAALAGDGGGMALASSAAYGNSVTGSLCSSCDASGDAPGLYASSTQTNDGDIYSSATIRTNGAGVIGATSTAIGNAATYAARPPGG